jgi:undecaprenyl diphosphate synthase
MPSPNGLEVCRRLRERQINVPILFVTARGEDVDEETFAGHLYAPEMPDPDLVIRTSGELRVSNFLLWQSAYSEFIFTDTLWPDFGPAEFRAAIEDYASRRRRFGGR